MLGRQSNQFLFHLRPSWAWIRIVIALISPIGGSWRFLIYATTLSAFVDKYTAGCTSFSNFTLILQWKLAFRIHWSKSNLPRCQEAWHDIIFQKSNPSLFCFLIPLLPPFFQYEENIPAAARKSIRHRWGCALKCYVNNSSKILKNIPRSETSTKVGVNGLDCLLSSVVFCLQIRVRVLVVDICKDLTLIGRLIFFN